MSTRAPLAQLGHWLAERFPQRCASCELDSPRSAICPACRADWPRAAERELRPLAWVQAPYAYEPPVTDLVTRMKFSGERVLATALGQALGDAVALRTEPTAMLVPIPLHRRRLVERGFNQAYEIARPLSRATGIPVRLALAKPKATPAQSGLSAAARRSNLRGSFAAKRWVKGQSIILVDDVVTTGATLLAAASALRASGASEVAAVAVAQVQAPN